MAADDLHRRHVETLYVEAMLLADEARSFFDDHGRQDGQPADHAVRTILSIESLRVTTRIMHVVAWLLNRRAALTGEIDEQEARDPSRSLGTAPATDPGATALLPDEARVLIQASIDIHARCAALEAALVEGAAPDGPARALQQILAERFAETDEARI